MALAIVTLIIGLILGIVIAYFFLRSRIEAQLGKWKEEWKTRFEDRVRKETLERSRASLKGRVGEQLAPLLPMFKYEPADARHIGSPVDYVVFRGHAQDDPKGVTFVEIKSGESARLTTKERKFKEAIESGEVDWETLHIEEEGANKKPHQE